MFKHYTLGSCLDVFIVALLAALLPEPLPQSIVKGEVHVHHPRYHPRVQARPNLGVVVHRQRFRIREQRLHLLLATLLCLLLSLRIKIAPAP